MRPTHRLNALTVKRLAKPGRHADGDGLYLQIDNSGGKSWIFMYRSGSKRRIMGLGSARSVSLAEARDAAEEAARVVRKGADPIATRNKRKAGAMTFLEAADKCFAEVEAGWRSDGHRMLWRRSLLMHAKPILAKAVSEITPNDVVRVLTPLWITKPKPETAIRLRGRIERILDWAKANDQREGENPAAWKGNLKYRLPALPKPRQRVQHHPALPYDEMPAFMARLRDLKGTPARCLEFLILTAARAAEAKGAQWTEIDFEQQLWKLPANRMKGGVNHVVPLSERAMQLLSEQAAVRSSALVFPGFADGRPLDHVTIRKAMWALGISTQQASVHGFRSSFRDWAEDRTPFHREADMALAHAIGDETERAYRRGTALDKRRELMNAWSNYCQLQPGTVTWLNATGAANGGLR